LFDGWITGGAHEADDRNAACYRAEIAAQWIGVNEMSDGTERRARLLHLGDVFVDVHPE